MGYRRLEALPQVFDLVLKEGIGSPLSVANPLPKDAQLVSVNYNARWHSHIVAVFQSKAWDGRDELIDPMAIPPLDPMPLFLRERSVT